MTSVRIFVSSPGDVKAERLKIEWIFERLQREFSGRLALDCYFWEHEPMRLDRDPQSQLEAPRKFDLFICVLWSRLGTKLHPSLHRKPDGSPYASGTEYELLDALEGYRQSNRAPQVFIYKRKEPPRIPAEPLEEGQRILNDYHALGRFISELTKRDGCYIGGSRSYDHLEMFESIFAGDMRKVLEKFVPPGAVPAHLAEATWIRGSPFRGLRHFDFEHAAIFFGRTRDIEEVIRALTKQAAEQRAFVLVFGGSGVGKSSLVRAGVLPLLTESGVVDGIGLWRYAIMRPSEVNQGDLFDALALALWRDTALPELGSDGTTVTYIAEQLRATPESIGLLIKGGLSQAANREFAAGKFRSQPRALLALAIDQFEELFTVERLASQRDGFLRAIDALARSGFVWVMATLRSDFYGRCEQSSILMELKEGAGQYHLRSPNEMQLGQMIRLPAIAAGLLFEEDHKTGRRLDDILRDSATASLGTLPLLEFALDELYVQRDTDRGLLRLEAYQEMGGVAGALGKRAEESFLKTSERAQRSFSLVCRKLVTMADHGLPAVRRRARKDDIERDVASAELVGQLIEDRLLMVDRHEDETVVVSVAHEAMLESWPRLKDWIAGHRESLRAHADVTSNAQRWIENGCNPDYLLPGGLPLDRAKEVLNAGFLNQEEEKFVRTSLRKVAAEEFTASLVSGERMHELARRLRAEFPDVYLAVLEAALQAPVPATRAHGASLLASDPESPLAPRLIPLISSDPVEAVCRSAAASLIKLNRPALFAAVFQGGEDASGALARLRVAADAESSPTNFEPQFQALPGRQRRRIVFRARLLRLMRCLPSLLVVLIPTVIFSSLIAAFKFFPGLFNYALCQAEASGPAAVFHGVTASFLWGGIITLSIVLHRFVFVSELGARSYLRPAGTLLAGGLGGLVSSVMIVSVIALVFAEATVVNMGWTTVARSEGYRLFFHDIAWESRTIWPYLIMGTGLGIGMAIAANGLLGSPQWAAFLDRQSAFESLRQVRQMIGGLIRLLLRFAWPIPLCLAVADIIAFNVVRHELVTPPSSAASWSYRLFGGLEPMGPALLAWKKSSWGHALGIIFDSAIQGFGGFFCLVGAALGLVAIRYGVKFEPRKD